MVHFVADEACYVLHCRINADANEDSAVVEAV